MARHLLMITIVLAWLALMPLSAATQEATPMGSPALSDAHLELPALALTPRDLEAAGFPGYGLKTSTLALGPELMASTIFFQRMNASQVTLLADLLRSAGANESYASWLTTVDPNSGKNTRDIVVSIDEYTDAAGAGEGLELISHMNQIFEPDFQTVTGTRTFGDGSQIVLYGATGAGGDESIPWLDMQIQSGALNVGVGILDYTGKVPQVAEIEALAEAALAKIESERDGTTPGLSFHGLRLAPAVYSFDNYVRRDDVDENYADESEEDRRVRLARYGSALDFYIVGQFLAPDDTSDFSRVVRVQNVLGRFASEDAAAAYIAEIPEILAADPALDDVAVQMTSVDLGDESLAVTYSAASPDGGTYYHDWLSVREGDIVSTVIVRSLGNHAPPAAVGELATAAFACLHSDGWCPPVAAPPELLDLHPSATPVP